MPNDTLIVRLNRVRTNRDWAQSGSQIMRNALEPGTLGNLKWDQTFNSRWKLDPAGFAVKYDVVDLVGTQVSIAAKVPKAALAKLTKS
jgi:hypothetical protein